MDIEQQLRKLDEGQREVLRRIDKVADELGEVTEDLHNTMIEIGGVPDEIGRNPQRKSIRLRLHELENDRDAQDIAQQAITAMKTVADAANQKRFTRREKLAGLLLAAFVAVGPYLSALLFHS